jgi:hypothetical protein
LKRSADFKKLRAPRQTSLRKKDSDWLEQDCNGVSLVCKTTALQPLQLVQ